MSTSHAETQENAMNVERVVDLRLIEMFLDNATMAMTERMEDGRRRGWGTSWREGYSDADVTERLTDAVEDLRIALERHRKGYPMEAELRKRAADVANQAFMLADEHRLKDAAG